MVKRFVGLLTLILLMISVVVAQEGITVTTIDTLRVRYGPGTQFAEVNTLNPRVDVILEGRNSVGDWVRVHTLDNMIEGWVASRFLIYPDYFNIGDVVVLPMPSDLAPPTGDVPVDEGTSVEEATEEAADVAAGSSQLSSIIAEDSAGTGVVIASILNIRMGPGQGYDTIGEAPRNMTVSIIGRNSVGDWILVETPDGIIRGWVASRFVAFNGELDLITLTVMDDVVGSRDENVVVDTPVNPYASLMEAQLMAIPVIPTTISERTREIFQHGLSVGNNPRHIAKIGDCNTESLAFLRAFDWNNYDLGEYDYLQATVNHFNGTFSRESVAGITGYSALTAIDSTWANPVVCKAGESSASCELRITNASFAVIMFGANDIQVLDAARYEDSIRQIVEMSIDRGTVPILTTFTGNPSIAEKWPVVLEYNLITVNVAQEYGVPLINFWRAAVDLPANGMAVDNAHLTGERSARISFGEDDLQTGYAMRNLVTLQTLDVLRTQLGY